MNCTRVLFFLLMVLAHGTQAQEKYLNGFVFDQMTKDAIPFATVVFYEQSDLVDGIVTNEKGKFQIAIPQNFSNLEISFIGYETVKILPTELTGLDELKIGLQPDTEALDEVVVKSERTTIQQKIDRKIINIGSDIQQAGVNALEAFDQIPEVQTDIANGTVSLRGNDNIRILVNGKLSPLTATELLQQIPASQVDRIEIITSPSSKYRADGLSGIINIILREKRDSGLNVRLIGTAGTRRHSYCLDGNYSVGSVNLRLNASKSHLKTTNNQTINRSFSTGTNENVFTPYKFDGDVYKIVGGIDFFLNDQHEVSLTFDHTDDSHNYFNQSFYFDVTNREDYTYLRVNDHFHFINIFNANYRLNLDNDNHYLELDFNINSSNNEYPITDFEGGVQLFDQNLKEDFVLQSLAADYNLPFYDKGFLETGFSLNTQELDSESIFEPEGSSATQSLFEYGETLWGIYGIGKTALGKLQLQAGFRFEYFKSEAISSTNNFGNKQEYSNFFPSLHLTYQLNDKNTVNIGYSKRISRPDFHQINAFQIVNPLFVWEYNPNITPEYSHNIDANYLLNMERTDLSLTAFYRKRKDVILWTESSTNNRQIFRYENSGDFNSLGLEAAVDFKIIPFWESRISSNFYYTNIERGDLVTWNNTYSSSIQLKNTISLTKKISFDATLIHNPKQQNAFNYIEPRTRIDFSLRARLMRDRLSLNLRIVDVLNDNLLVRNSRTPNLTQRTFWDIQLQTRNYLVSASYTLFENKMRSRQRKYREYNESPID